MLIPKVLLVNDDPASLFALESLLLDAAARLEYELITAGSGQDALRQVLLHDFAVILLDVSMPGMDGFETAEAIHSHPRTYAVPIIFITAHYADELNRLKAYQSGAADYLFTPIVPQMLQAKVSVFVELTKKNLQLQTQTALLHRLNRDLHVQRLQDLERINAELELEVAERKLAEERAHALSIRDVLTGLVNRRALIEHLEHAVASADRNGSEFALLFLDLDKFKSINDTLGHEVGDELLRQVAARLMASVRVSDVVARLGGDEFVVLVEGKGAAANAARVARKIGQAHARPYDIGRQRILTSTSIGIGLYPQDGNSAQALMKNADLAMYHAKQERRGSIKFFHEELNAREHERELWRQELGAALAGDQLELWFQPRAEVLGGRISGVEALLHWRHPRHGLLDAGQFLPQVPDRILLDQLDAWCIAAACAQAAKLAARYAAAGRAGVPTVAINLVTAQLQPELATQVAAQLRLHGLAPGSLGIELPETLLCAPFDHVAPVLRALGAAGVPISVDHFGSAGASLVVCQSLALDGLKIDGNFVAVVADHDGGRDMAGAIILLARALSLPAVALDVRNAAQLKALRELGCGEYQGDLLCPPLPADGLHALLLEGPAAAPQAASCALAPQHAPAAASAQPAA